MSINIKDVVSLTGVSGLFHIVKQDDRAIIVESIDERKKRQMIKGNMMVSKLLDISIYTKDDESEPLLTVLENMKEKYGNDLPVTKKSSKNELMDFLEEVLPAYDKERVYPSNVKKLIGWYEIMSAYNVDLTVETEEDTEEGTEGQETEKEATAE